jgi:DHA2 family multidrug resistance protein
MAESGFRKWIITITVIFASLLEIVDTTVVNVALTNIMGNLGATLEEVAWLITAYAVANVIILPMSGWLSAKFGRRNYFVFSIMLFTLASLGCGNSTNIWELALFRFIQGIGGGALLSTSQSILFETFKPEERGMANAIFGIGVVIGPTLGPTLGGFITDHFSWPWIFYINLPLGIIAALLAMYYIRDQKEVQKPPRVDWWGIMLLITSVGALQVVLERGEAEDWFETTYISLLTLVSIIGVLLFIWREMSIDHPVVDLRILKDRSLAIGMIFTFVLGFGLYASVFVLPIFVQNLLGFTAQQTGEIFIPSGLVTIIVMPIVGTLLKKNFPAQLLAACGFVLFFVFTSQLSQQTLASGEHDFFYPLLIRGIGMGFLFVPLTTLALSGLNHRNMAQGVGLNNMMRQLGGSFGVALMTTFIQQRVAKHFNDLIAHVTVYDTQVQQRLTAYTQAFIQKGYAYADAQQVALKALNGAVMKQAMLMAYTDAFWIVGVFFLFCIPFLAFQRKSKAAVAVEGAH